MNTVNLDPNSIGTWLCAVLVGYCFGCLDMAWFAGFLQGRDIKKLGNGNAGASNALMTLGIVPAIVTAVWDVGKAGLAYLFLYYGFGAGREAGLLAAGVSVIGHCYPFWLEFDGGKGFAPYLGFMLLLDWRLAMLPVIIGLVLALVFDKIVLMTFACIALTPVGALLARGEPHMALLCLALSLTILWRHRANIRSLRDGTEPGIRPAFRAAGGKYKNGDT